MANMQRVARWDMNSKIKFVLPKEHSLLFLDPQILPRLAVLSILRFVISPQLGSLRPFLSARG